MNPRDLPPLCAFHEGRLRTSYVHNMLDPSPPDWRLEAVVESARFCHYCERLRGRRFYCCDFEPDPNPGHDHEWRQETVMYVGPPPHTDSRGSARDDNEIRMSGCGSCREAVLRCRVCGVRVSRQNVYAPETFAHVCQICGKDYRDGDPFSQLCSRDCLVRLRAEKQKRYIADVMDCAGDESLAERFRAGLRDNLRVLAASSQGATVFVAATDALARWQRLGLPNY